MSAIVEFLQEYKIDLTQETLWYTVAHVIFNPTYWNIIARLEYKDQVVTRIANNNSKVGCYLLAATIFTLGLSRDWIFKQSLAEQEIYLPLDQPLYHYLGAACFAWGNILVLTSMWALGVTGTYLGDYFGILMDDIVTSFPFNVSNNPMYHGSTFCFLGTSLWYAKPAGLFVTVIVHLTYSIACRFEEPFTAMIYAKRDEENKKKQ